MRRRWLAAIVVVLGMAADVRAQNVSCEANVTSECAGSSSGSGSGTTLPVDDMQTIVKGSVDSSKLLRFEVDGFTTGTTRVATFPDADITVAQLGAQTFTGAQQFPSGTAGAPSVAVGASNRGVYDTGGAIGISYGGTLTFYSNGSYAAVSAGTAFSPDNGNNLWVTRTQKTPDAPTFELSAASNSIHVNEIGDFGFDFQNCSAGTSAATNPLLCIHSAAQSTTQWVDISHNGTNGVINAGAGGVVFPMTGSMGWSIVAAANQACTTTCTNAAVFGFDGSTPVGPTDATADTCLCAGAN